MVDLAGPRLLDELAPETRAWLAALGRRETHNDGALIHVRGDNSPTMGIVIEGKVRLVRMRHTGSESFVTTINPGQHFADVLMFENGVRTHSAIAVGKVTIDQYDAAAFAQILERNEIVQALYRIASVRLVRAITMIDDLRTLPREGHLAKLLLSLAPTADDKGNIACIQEDLAGILGVTPVTLAKALSTLKREGLVETGYRQVRIKNAKAMRSWLRALEPD